MFNPSKKITTSDIQELYYITDIDNVPSILDKGILSHNAAKDIPHIDISNEKIQALRKDKTIPTEGSNVQLPLWSFVCLFAQPHNAMMYVSKSKHICVIRIDKRILENDDIFITDRNASCHNAIFFRANKWTLSNATAKCLYSRHSLPVGTNQMNPNDYKSIRQLEVLCPKLVAKKFILGFFAKKKEDMTILLKIIQSKILSLPVVINENLFFLGKSPKLETFAPLSHFIKETKESNNTSKNADNDEIFIIDELNALALKE